MEKRAISLYYIIKLIILVRKKRKKVKLILKEHIKTKWEEAGTEIILRAIKVELVLLYS